VLVLSLGLPTALEWRAAPQGATALARPLHPSSRPRDRTSTLTVVNTQDSFDLSGTYAVTRRFSMALALPIVRASWSIPLPVNATGQRNEQNAQGIGDVTVTGRY